MNLWIIDAIIWFIVLAAALGPLALVMYYRKEVAMELEDFSWRWLGRWVLRGGAIPVLAWFVLSLKTMPQLRGQLLTMRTWFSSGAVLWFWAAVTFGWFLTGLIKRARNYEDLAIAALFWSPSMLLIFACTGSILGWAGCGFGAVIWLCPLTHYALEKGNFKQPAPTYGRAIGKLKFGKYAEAEKAIIGELEKCENDFDGWMMLAELYAFQFNDLEEATRAITDLCDDPATTLPQASVALHRLADWYISLRGDPIAARRILAEISARMPGTHLDKMARHRTNQLASSSEELALQQQVKKVHMPALNDSLGEDQAENPPSVSREEATASANQFVEILKQDPNNVPARENLARTFAEQLGQSALGIEQIGLLLDMPEQPPEKLAGWLSLLAAWHIKYRNDTEAGKRFLHRLIQDFPQSPQAFAAQRRLYLMDMEARSHK